MTVKTDLEEYIRKTHASAWTSRDGQKVPETEDIGLSNDAVKIEGAVLYADLAESTALVQRYDDWFAAEIYKNYLYTAGRIIRNRGGIITGYDGDRIMAVFIGGSKNSSAAKCGLEINGAVRDLLQPSLLAKYPTTKYVIKQKVGIDTSPLFVARTGIRGSNDLVWVGSAANNAAKMAALSSDYATYISVATYNRLDDDAKYAKDPRVDKWTNLGNSALGYQIYGSTWSRHLS